MRVGKILGLLAVCLGLQACSTYSLAELRTVPARGTPFQAALAIKYLDYSEQQARNYDWIDSGYFADKGLIVAYGRDVEPEELSSWNIPANSIDDVTMARGTLIKALTPEAKEQKPEQAAKAQYSFDCWVENLEEGWRTEEIVRCREQLIDALAALSSVGPYASKSEPSKAPQPMAGEAAYLVFFGSNRAVLDTSGERQLDAVVEDLKKQDTPYEVVLNGHADAAGDSRYNMGLSQKRAESVLQALVDRGIPKALVRAFGYGETDPLKSTPDGKPEQQNRRVEIFLGH